MRETLLCVSVVPAPPTAVAALQFRVMRLDDALLR
jgi:hypothetical protein